MKHKTNNQPTAPARKARWQSLAASALPIAACTLLLAGCMESNILPTDDRDTPIEFTATVQSATPLADRSAAPNTRTAIGSDGKTVWAPGDAVGVFMFNAGSTMPDGIVSQADNIQYTINPTTGTLTPAQTPIYYPMSGAVDFIAYYPYGENEAGGVTEDYTYEISLTDQTKPASIDLLYAKTPNRSKSNPQVSLNFSHVMSKVVFDITLGDGMDGNTPADITAMNIIGMPASATLHLNDGTTTSGDATPFDALLEAIPSTDAQATFSALVPPQAESDYAGRSIVITVGGKRFTGTIPDATAFAPNTMYTFPVTVQHKRVTVGKPAITDWITSNNGSSTAEFLYTVTFNLCGAEGTVPAPISQDKPNAFVRIPTIGEVIIPDGKIFGGWNTASNNSGTVYHPKNNFQPKRNTILYAMWLDDGSTEDKPTPIFDERGLRNINKALDRHYVLARDITVTNWSPIGFSDSPFKGTFNGQGHTVTINSVPNLVENIGLFAKGDGCLIKQVCVAGNIAYSTPSDNPQTQNAGAIVGEAVNGCIIENCLVTANITISANNSIVGGIVGLGTVDGKKAMVRNCLVRGNLNQKATSGGMVGGIVGLRDLYIANCVVLSEEINNASENGLLVRIGEIGILHNNYASSEMVGMHVDTSILWKNIGLNNLDGANCDPRPNLEWWKNLKTWKTDEGFAAWDFTNIWKMGSDGYPCLRIQR